ncbi:MAG TPA: LLM class flavin-dependent oxidoreductase [Solirubrobacterales bacterium]|nr:LLM class flavin-dependent oxidoreductase [Solirubrobacterales bacterium]
MVPISILDLAAVGREESIAESFAGSVLLAQTAERGGYRRVWYAEHHSIPSIASSATAVLIAHIAAHTSTIRLGAGGVMLPNHSPLVIAEQFGTLATLHPGRIDLGLGRAPGSDQQAARALRRDPRAPERFPQDVVELQGLLGEKSPLPGVRAIPGQGTDVPLYILGSSLFGAQLAASLGLPYAFASHFAPQALDEAIQVYRERFQPSPRHERPYLIAGVGVIAADTGEAAAEQLEATRRARAKNLFGRPDRRLGDEEVEAILRSPQGAAVDEMLTYTAVGTREQVAAYLEDFQRLTGADELIVVHYASSVAARIRSVELLAEAVLQAGDGSQSATGESPLTTLSRWEEFGALWRTKSITAERAVVELCSCHGEPVDELSSTDPELLKYLRRRPDSTCEAPTG